MSEGGRVRFEADGFLVRPSWVWLVGPVLATSLAIWLLHVGNVLGMVPQTVSMILLAVGLQRRPKRHLHARIVVDDRAILADGKPLVALADVVGLSVTGSGDARHLVIAKRNGAPIQLTLPSDVHVAELRAAIGLSLARAATESFEGHSAFGCVSGIVALGASMALVVTLCLHADYSHPFVLGMLAPAAVAGIPLLLARLRTHSITCGAEGLYVRRLVAPWLFGRRMIPWNELASAEGIGETTIALVSKRRRRDYELGSAEDLARLVQNVRERASLPSAERDANIGALLARGAQPTEAWLASARKQGAPGNESYRATTLPEDRLWAVVEDPGADPTARVGAAIALRTQLRIAEVGQRIRVAAGTTALPEVRDALSEIAEEEDEDRVTAKVARIFAR